VRARALLLVVWSCAACAPSPASQWERAQSLFQARDPAAFVAYASIDARSAQGSEARRLIAQAETHYRRGIAELERGEPGARESLQRGTAIAPMDPALYLPLARACRDRALPLRAAEFYRKYLAFAGNAPGAAEVARELGALEAGLDGIFDPVTPAPPRALPSPLWLTLLTVPVGLFVFGASWLRRRRPRRSLIDLARESPELQPAIAYLVSCMRHELFKHRINAARLAFAAAPAAGAERAFAVKRLYHGEPLVLAWTGHLAAILRALGPRFDLVRTDPAFRAAQRALNQVGRLELPLRRGDPGALERLTQALERLQAFDRGLAELVVDIERTRIDGALLREVVAAVQSEYAAGSVTLDEVVIDEPPADVWVSAYRIDLMLVFKNVVRNAILAVGARPSPRKIGIDVRVDIEPTGEEMIRVRVRDTSPELLDVEALVGRRERGLGLCASALQRYDGGIESEPGGDGYAKAVVVRLFRALEGGAVEEAAA
jgi:signal transduction histidine kinase